MPDKIQFDWPHNYIVAKVNYIIRLNGLIYTTIYMYSPYLLKQADGQIYHICQMYSCNQVENEIHFLFHCSYYDDVRKPFIENILNEIPYFTDLDEKLRVCIHKNLLIPSVNMLTIFFISDVVPHVY